MPKAQSIVNDIPNLKRDLESTDKQMVIKMMNVPMDFLNKHGLNEEDGHHLVQPPTNEMQKTIFGEIKEPPRHYEELKVK